MSTTTQAPIAQTPRRRRWWRVVLGLVVSLIAVPAFWMGVSHWTTQNDWAAAVQEAAQDMPRWTLLEMEEDRRPVADADNSALHVMAIVRTGKPLAISGAPHHEKIFAKLPPNAELNHQQANLGPNGGARRVAAARRRRSRKKAIDLFGPRAPQVS